ncbi:hypothetical protein PV797_16955 [Clostridiaceae bacterium M8S5]|nr:hypothetical protein PV797_16955 [Clostridiaceae bacterium M8S5]
MQKNMKQSTKNLLLILGIMILIFSLSVGCASNKQESGSGDTSKNLNVSLEDIVKEYSKFINDNYNIVFSKKVNKKEFTDAFSKVLNYTEEDQKDSSFTSKKALSFTVRAAGLEELAYAYPDEKIKTALEKAKVAYKINESNKREAQEIALAIDTKLITQKFYDYIINDKPVDSEFASLLLGRACNFKGKYKNYLGYINDEDISSKIYHAWLQSSLVSSSKLEAIAEDILKQNIITGYNVKDTRYTANFDKDLSITYSHSDISHAIQLIELLKSENVNAKVQFEPKSSAYVHLKEWGKPDYPDFKLIPLDDGNSICYSKEYDLSFEFESKEKKDMFNNIILKYAKKKSKDQKGLLVQSWWVPLYSSDTQLKDYVSITNNKFIDGRYFVQTFSVTEDSKKIVEEFMKKNSNLKAETYEFWVNKAFLNYLKGEDK